MLSASQYTALLSLANCPGATGATGTGDKGDTGEKGNTGDTGQKGETGNDGATGAGSEVSASFSVRALTGATGTSPTFQWSITGVGGWSSTDVSLPNYIDVLNDNTEIRGLIFNGNVWVCSIFVKTASASTFPQFLHSSDGKKWTASDSVPFGNANEIRGAYKIAWNGRMFVAVGTSSSVSVAYSIDNGITWTPVASSRANIIQFGRGIAWNGKAWLLTGTPAVSTDSIAYSLNGVSWTRVTPAAGVGNGFSVATDGKRWVVGGTNSLPIHSSDTTGSTGWASSSWTATLTNSRITDIAWNGRQWLLVADNTTAGQATVAISDNGTSWTTALTETNFNLAQSLCWNSLAWIVTGTSSDNSKNLLYSIDNAANWTSISSTGGATSVTSRTIPASFYAAVPYINVRDFGAIGDGTTPDDIAINAAIAYARKYPNGARVIVPAGTYFYGADLTVDDNIEFVQETGAKLTNSSGFPTAVTSNLSSIRSRIIKNNDEANGLSSYNGLVMNGAYATGEGLGNDATRSVANMFDIKTDKREIGRATAVTVAGGPWSATSSFELVGTGYSVGRLIKFNVSRPPHITAGQSYYITSVNTLFGNTTTTISSSPTLTPNILVTLNGGDAATIYDSTDVFGSTLTGRAILSTADIPIGGRIGVEGRVEQTAATPALINLNKRYVGLSGISTTSSGDGGTNLTDTARGEYFGGKFGASLVGNSATNVRSIIGAQFDVRVPNATASSKYVFGASSVSSITAINSGTKANAAYQVGGATGTTGWLHGILFSDASGGTPLKTGATGGGSVIGTYWDTPGTKTITNGIDLSGFDIGQNVLASPRLQIQDKTGDVPTITTTGDNPIRLFPTGTGTVKLKSGSTEVNVTNSGTTFVGNIYATMLKAASGGDALLELQSTGTGNVEIKSTGTGKVSLLSNTEVAAGKECRVKNSNASGGDCIIVNDSLVLGANASNSSFIKSSTTVENSNLRLSSHGTGKIQLQSDTDVAANKSLAVITGVAGRGNTTLTSDTLKLGANSGGIVNIGISDTNAGTDVDLRISSKGTGAISLNGRTEIASGFSFTHLGSGEFQSTSGNVSLNGNTTVVTNKKLTVTTTLGLGSSGAPVQLQDTASGGTAYVSGNLNSDGNITTDTLRVNGIGIDKLLLGNDSSQRTGLGNNGGGGSSIAYVSGNLDSNGIITTDTLRVNGIGESKLLLGASASQRTGLGNALNGLTAFVSGDLDSTGNITTSLELRGTSIAVTGTGTDAIKIGRNTSGTITRSGLANLGNLFGTTAYVAGNLDSNGNILLSGASSQLGFTTGAGGTVTQLTSRSTDVILNRPTGTIQVYSAVLNSLTSVNIPLVNNTIVPNDMVIVQHVSGGTLGLYNITAIATASGATITMRNNTATASPNEAPVLRFVVIKSVNA